MRPSYEAFGLGVDGGAGGSELGCVTWTISSSVSIYI